MTQFGLKELYDVTLRAVAPLTVGNRIVEKGEAVAYFDKIQIANFQEIQNTNEARGGWDGRGLVFWETTREVRLVFSQGIFSQTQFALMNNVKLLEIEPVGIPMSQREEVESDENGFISLKYEPDWSADIFIYNKDTGEKLKSTIEDDKLKIDTAFQNLVVDYTRIYTSAANVATIGQRLTQGFLRLEGKTRIKDDITGQTHTALVVIPQLKLRSTLNLRLGQLAAPQVGTFSASAIPTGDRTNTFAMQVFFLEDDVDSDM